MVMRCDRKDARIPSIPRDEIALAHARVLLFASTSCGWAPNSRKIIHNFSLRLGHIVSSIENQIQSVYYRKRGGIMVSIREGEESVKARVWSSQVYEVSEQAGADRLCTVASLPTIKLRQVCPPWRVVWAVYSARHSPLNEQLNTHLYDAFAVTVNKKGEGEGGRRSHCRSSWFRARWTRWKFIGDNRSGSSSRGSDQIVGLLVLFNMWTCFAMFDETRLRVNIHSYGVMKVSHTWNKFKRWISICMEFYRGKIFKVFDAFCFSFFLSFFFLRVVLSHEIKRWFSLKLTIWKKSCLNFEIGLVQLFVAGNIEKFWWLTIAGGYENGVTCSILSITTDTEAYCALSQWWNWPCGTPRQRDTVAQGSCPRFTFRGRSDHPNYPILYPRALHSLILQKRFPRRASSFFKKTCTPPPANVPNENRFADYFSPISLPIIISTSFLPTFTKNLK